MSDERRLALREILAGLQREETIEFNTPQWRHLSFRAWSVLTEPEKRIFRLRFPGRPDPTCDCEKCR